MAEWVTPCRAAARSQAPGSKLRRMTTVPPVSRVQPMPAQEMFENSPMAHRLTVARS